MIELPSRPKKWCSPEQGAGASRHRVNDTCVVPSRAFQCLYVPRVDILGSTPVSGSTFFSFVLMPSKSDCQFQFCFIFEVHFLFLIYNGTSTLIYNNIG